MYMLLMYAQLLSNIHICLCNANHMLLAPHTDLSHKMWSYFKSNMTTFYFVLSFFFKFTSFFYCELHKIIKMHKIIYVLFYLYKRISTVK